jgi:hypothetical protein
MKLAALKFTTTQQTSSSGTVRPACVLPHQMKKLLPSKDELVSGVIIVVVALIVWNFVGAPILNAINKAKMKVSGSA